jgi:uncharacterized SAM-binding protein YcdF (DUF218 family)
LKVNKKKSAGAGFRRFFTWLMLIAAGAYLSLVCIGLLLVSPDLNKQADAMVVLSGGGKPRAAEALRLYNAGAAQVIILTQTSGKGSIATMVDTRTQLVRGGVPSYQIQPAYGTATSTYDEARQVTKLVKSAGFKSILVVTDPYHTLRARVLFAGELGSMGVKVRMAAVADHWYQPLNWMTSREGWRVTLTELAKIGGIILGMRGG